MHGTYFSHLYDHDEELSIVVIAILQVPFYVILAQIIGIDAAITRSAGMNVNSGGPHILLFERDQQLTGLLTSEFQLAGYECHAARTASSGWRWMHRDEDAASRYLRFAA